MVDHDAHQLRERDGQKREIDPADGEAAPEIADQQPGQDRESDGRHEAPMTGGRPIAANR